MNGTKFLVPPAAKFSALKFSEVEKAARARFGDDAVEGAYFADRRIVERKSAPTRMADVMARFEALEKLAARMERAENSVTLAAVQARVTARMRETVETARKVLAESAVPALPTTDQLFAVARQVYGSLTPARSGDDEADKNALWKLAYESLVHFPGQPSDEELAGRKGFWRPPPAKCNGLRRTSAVFQQSFIDRAFQALDGAKAKPTIPAGLKGRERAVAAFNAQFANKKT